MDEPSLPHAAADSQPHAKNFDGFSNFSGRSVTAEEFLASVDQDNKYHLQLEDSIDNHPLVTKGMNKTLGAIKILGKDWGHISLSPKVMQLLKTMTKFESDTIRKHITALIKYTLIFEVKKLNGEAILIYAGTHHASRKKANQHYDNEVAADKRDRQELEEKRKADRERKAAARAARAKMNGKQSEEIKQADAQSEELKHPGMESHFSGSAPGTDMPESRHEDATESARKCQDSGTDVPSVSMGVQHSYITPNNNFKNTTHEESPCEVEESRAYQDAERDGVVFSIDNFDEENAWAEWNEEYVDADAPDLINEVENVCDDQINIAMILSITSKPRNSSKPQATSAGPVENADQQAPPAPQAGPVETAVGPQTAPDDPFADRDTPTLAATPAPVAAATATPVATAGRKGEISRKVLASMADEFGWPTTKIESVLVEITKGASQQTLDKVLDQAKKGYDKAKALAKGRGEKIESPWSYYKKILKNKVKDALALARENGGKQLSGVYYVPASPTVFTRANRERVTAIRDEMRDEDPTAYTSLEEKVKSLMTTELRQTRSIVRVNMLYYLAAQHGIPCTVGNCWQANAEEAEKAA